MMAIISKSSKVSAMGYSKNHTEKTREKILSSAAKLFRRHGYNGVGIEQIMADAGLTRGGFYAHFKSKEWLFVGVLKRELGFAEQLRLARESSGDGPHGRARALRAVRFYLDPAHRNRVGRGCTMASNAADISRCSKRARHAFTRAFEELVAEISGLVAASDVASARPRSLAALATCVGAISLARALSDESLVIELMTASTENVLQTLGHGAPNT